MRRIVLLFALFAHCTSSTSAAPDAQRAEAAAPNANATLTFAVQDRTVRLLSSQEIERLARAEDFAVVDPYYRKLKRFRVVSLDAVLEHAFRGAVQGPLQSQQFLLRALDGFTVPISGDKLLGNGALLALRDLDVPGWEPIPPRLVNPGPFYVLWRGAQQQDPELFARPYQLARIELARFEDVFPHTAPTGTPEGSPAQRGYALFREYCVRCHAINREGGRVGPDLNVPQSIVEYRPEAQIRAYITDPLQFRYGAMPAHPHLTTQDLDALLGYFHAMSARKFDPERRTPDAGASPTGAR